MVTTPSRRLFSLFLMLGLAGQGLVESLLLDRAVLAQTESLVSLKLRKEPNYLDLTLTGIGDSARVVQERSTSTRWRAEIIRSDKELSTKEVAQQVAKPEMGLASVRLRGSGSTYELEVTSVAGRVLPKPKISPLGRIWCFVSAASQRHLRVFKAAHLICVVQRDFRSVFQHHH